MSEYIWVKCPNGHGTPGEQHFDYCGLCAECGAVLIEIGEPPALKLSASVRPEDIPLEAIEAFHEVNPLAMNEPYDWPDSTLARVRDALSAAVNVMLAGTQDEPPLKEGPLLLAMAARNARKNAE